MRPAPLLIRLAIFVAIAALITAVVPVFVWVVVVAVVLLFVAGLVEAFLLRRVRVQVERQAKLAIPLDEHEEVTLRITTSARRALRMTVRQRWPELVEPRSSVAEAVCRPGEAVSLDFSIRGVARGTEEI